MDYPMKSKVYTTHTQLNTLKQSNFGFNRLSIRRQHIVISFNLIQCCLFWKIDITSISFLICFEKHFYFVILKGKQHISIPANIFQKLLIFNECSSGAQSQTQTERNTNIYCLLRPKTIQMFSY